MTEDQIRRAVSDRTPIVKQLAETTSKTMPEVKEKCICDKHGEFEFKYIKMWDNTCRVFSACPECVKEREQAIETEVSRIMKERKAERHMKNALEYGVSKRNISKTFENFVCTTPEQSKAKAYYSDFADKVSNGKPTSNLIVCGSVGTGKTHLASAVINQTVKSGKVCKLRKVIDIIRMFKESWSKSTNYTESDVIDHFSNLDGLIIDEVGVQFGSDTEKMVIFDIIDGRYNNMLPTIFISNLALPDVKELVGERVIDRLREDGGVVVAMSWESHRGK